MAMMLTSPVFSEGTAIDDKYTLHGENVSPPLTWTDVPAGTAELALIVEDTDVERHAWFKGGGHSYVHWVIYKIPPEAGGIPEGVPRAPELREPLGALQGDNEEAEIIGWTGPRLDPEHGEHHYRFTLYALDKPLEVNFGLDAPALRGVMEGHVIETAELVLTAER